MLVENPYVEEKRRLMIALETETDNLKRLELELQFQEAERKSREFIQSKLNDLQNTSVEIELELEEVENLPTKKQQYKEAIRLYRRVMGVVNEGELITPGLVHEIRDLKKSLRNED